MRIAETERLVSLTKIAFYAGHLSERGTGVALYDYAIENIARLGNESVVFYEPENPLNIAGVVDRFGAALELIPVADFAEADAMLAAERCDLVYALKAGRPDGVESRVVPTMVHGVFPVSTRHVHGASYAFVSDWLARYCAGGKVPAVPHIARVAETDADLRGDLGVPAEARVFGCYGGRDSFDIGFVRDQVIPEVLERRPDIWFLFMNITPFLDHERVRFLPASADLQVKTAFINSCDAMLHARSRGETFGMAVAEFSLRGKPVLTYARSRERAHLEMLGGAALRYGSAADLLALIEGFDCQAPSAREVYATRYAAAPVMERFARHLIEPAARNGIGGAKRGLGLRPWDALRLPLSKLRAALR